MLLRSAGSPFLFLDGFLTRHPDRHLFTFLQHHFQRRRCQSSFNSKHSDGTALYPHWGIIQEEDIKQMQIISHFHQQGKSSLTSSVMFVSLGIFIHPSHEYNTGKKGLELKRDAIKQDGTVSQWEVVQHPLYMCKFKPFRSLQLEILC